MEKRKINKRAAGMLAASALAVGISIGGTMAYLTDHKEATNSFTVGRVEIEGLEPHWDPDGDGNPGGIAEDIVPAQSWAKDPQIKNTGQNPAYVYIEVGVPMADAVYTDSRGVRQNGGDPAHIELFEFDGVGKEAQTLTDGIGVSEQNDKWTLLHKKEEDVDGVPEMVYTFCYNELLVPEEVTESLFDRITFANVVEGQLDGQELSVDVRFYAIQSQGTGDGEEGPAAARNAYGKYLRQNSGQESSADTVAGTE